LEQVLSISMWLGETYIVTNALELWVTESTRFFCPRVLPLLSQISVVSARRDYERDYPGDCFAWKREAFRDVLAKRRGAAQAGGSAGSSASLNMVVLGDSPAEMDAAQTSTFGATYPFTIKRVKFKEFPTVDELVEQLHVVVQELNSIVTDDRSNYRNLETQLWPQPATKQFQLPTHAVAPALPPAFGNTPPLDAAVAADPAQTSTNYGGPHMTYVVSRCLVRICDRFAHTTGIFLARMLLFSSLCFEYLAVAWLLLLLHLCGGRTVRWTTCLPVL